MGEEEGEVGLLQRYSLGLRGDFSLEIKMLFSGGPQRRYKFPTCVVS